MGGRGSSSRSDHSGSGGSSHAIDRPSRKAQATAHKEEARTKFLKHEEAMGVLDDGRVVLTKRGTRNKVEFTADEVSRLRNGTLTHNHPRGSAFSPEDITFATAYDLKQVRAVGRNDMGETHIFTATRPVGGWKHSRNETRRTIDHIAADMRDALRKKVDKGKMSPERANADFWHEVMKKASKALSFEYKRKRLR